MCPRSVATEFRGGVERSAAQDLTEPPVRVERRQALKPAAFVEADQCAAVPGEAVQPHQRDAIRDGLLDCEVQQQRARTLRFRSVRGEQDRYVDLRFGCRRNVRRSLVEHQRTHYVTVRSAGGEDRLACRLDIWPDRARSVDHAPITSSRSTPHRQAPAFRRPSPRAPAAGPPPQGDERRAGAVGLRRRFVLRLRRHLGECEGPQR